ncbi:MAG: hypothetical protein GWP09_01240 [Nitrospiraceae bacterium]|nr:hypothetical protein [Nitrospiraceae bacterium]
MVFKNKRAGVIGSTILEIVLLALAIIALIPIMMLFGFSFRTLLGLPDELSQHAFNRLIISSNTINKGNFYFLDTLSKDTIIVGVPSSSHSISGMACYAPPTNGNNQKPKKSITLTSGNTASQISLPCPKGRSCLCLLKLKVDNKNNKKKVTNSVEKVYSCKTIDRRINNPFCVYNHDETKSSLVEFAVKTGILSPSSNSENEISH